MKIYLLAGKARSGKDTVSQMIDEIYKEKNKKVVNIQITSHIKQYAKKITNWDGSDETKPRQLLQDLGTNIIRKQIDELFFVNRLIQDIKVYSHYFDVITVSDVREKKEIIGPRNNFNVIAVRVNRPNFDNGLSEEQKKHFTEVDLDDFNDFDYEIINDGSLEDLKNKVRKMVDFYES